MIKQNPLTLLTPVRMAKLDELTEILHRFKVGLNHGLNERFDKLGTLHYARWFILKEDSFRDPTAFPIPVRLVFSSNFDGTEEEHVEGLSSVFPEYFDELYACCEGYPEPAARNTESRKNYLLKWRVDTTAFYIGAPGRSLKQIQQEDKLKNHIWHFLNNNKWDGKSAKEVHQAILKEIDSKPEFEWSKQRAEAPGIKWFNLFFASLVALVLLPIILLWVLYIHLFHERRDKNGTITLSQIPDSKVSKLEEYEDLFPQNQFTQAVVMKPGWARLITFHAMMLLGRTLIKNLFVKGELMGIPTIHFARWVLIDNNKHVLFFSNFDGSWQQYLGDFIDKSGWGLTGIFSNTVNFPKTKFLGLTGILKTVNFHKSNFFFPGGAYDEEHFLAWSRSTQIPTQVWYSAYHHLSIKNINNNTAIRNELRKNLNEEQAQLFLKRF
ncbi:MAG: hypothetical protein ACM3H8_02685 [Sphingobacteriales bacterium]